MNTGKLCVTLHNCGFTQFTTSVVSLIPVDTMVVYIDTYSEQRSLVVHCATCRVGTIATSNLTPCEAAL